MKFKEGDKVWIVGNNGGGIAHNIIVPSCGIVKIDFDDGSYRVEGECYPGNGVIGQFVHESNLSKDPPNIDNNVQECDATEAKYID